jgi:hypothetical protein
MKWVWVCYRRGSGFLFLLRRLGGCLLFGLVFSVLGLFVLAFP